MNHSRFLSLLLLACCPLSSACSADDAHHDEHAGEEHEDHGGEEHADEVALDPEVAEQHGIRVTTAATGVLAEVVVTPARVSLSQDGIARVVPPFEGRIAEFLVGTGDAVTAGAPLARLQSPDWNSAQRSLTESAAGQAAAQQAEAVARESAVRARDLNRETGDPSLAEVRAREGRLAEAVAARVAAESATREAADRLWLVGAEESILERLIAGGEPEGAYLVRSPISGVVVERPATPGEVVGPDHPAVATIGDLKALWVVANFPESRLRGLRVGGTARVLFETEAGHDCAGVVEFISPVLDLTNRTVEVRVRAEDEHESLRPGMFARAEFELAPADAQPTVIIPEAALVRVEGRTAVFVPVANEPGVYALRTVVAGRPVRGQLPIHDGLAPGESYVQEGAFLLKAEMLKSAGGHDH